MKGMLLAAGAGERLKPLTPTQPKPLLPVLGRPLALQILHRLRNEGVDEAVVNLHHHAQQVRDAIGEGESSGLPRIRYSHEEQLLGTGGALQRAAAMLRGDGPIVVCNSDFLTDVELGTMLDHHRRSGALVTLALVRATGS